MTQPPAGDYEIEGPGRHRTIQEFNVHDGVPEAGLVTKLCIAGGSRMTHAYVCAVVELLQSQDPADAEFVESLRSCPIALYLLPTGGEASDNVLAEYIGRADGWYSRHILNALSSQVPAHPYPHQFSSI